jgi:hypothetical protein
MAILITLICRMAVSVRRTRARVVISVYSAHNRAQSNLYKNGKFLLLICYARRYNAVILDIKPFIFRVWFLSRQGLSCKKIVFELCMSEFSVYEYL